MSGGSRDASSAASGAAQHVKRTGMPMVAAISFAYGSDAATSAAAFPRQSSSAFWSFLCSYLCGIVVHFVWAYSVLPFPRIIP